MGPGTLEGRISTIIRTETVESYPPVQKRIAAIRAHIALLLRKGLELDIDLVRSAIRETAPEKLGQYRPADHGGRSYAQHARSEQRARENAQEDRCPLWMRNH